LIEILLSAAFGAWAVSDIDRAVAEGRMHLSWLRDEDYADLETDGKMKDDEGKTKGAVKLQYPNVIPATIREIVIKQLTSKKLNVLRETLEFEQDDRSIGYSWSSATGIVGSSRSGDIRA
ncbi:hypothetical protein PMAYCL1PPCAC_17588, partial [Pristionchus mayeri]